MLSHTSALSNMQRPRHHHTFFAYAQHNACATTSQPTALWQCRTHSLAHAGRQPGTPLAVSLAYTGSLPHSDSLHNRCRPLRAVLARRTWTGPLRGCCALCGATVATPALAPLPTCRACPRTAWCGRPPRGTSCCTCCAACGCCLLVRGTPAALLTGGPTNVVAVRAQLHAAVPAGALQGGSMLLCSKS